MTDEEYEDELLAPPGDVATGVGPVTEDPTDQPEAQWYPFHGFPDSRTAVRVWVDEQSRELTRVHVSPRWREVLGPKRTLDDAFREALFAASVRAGGPDPFLPQPDDDAEPGALDAAHLDAEEVRARITNLNERFDELAQRPPHDVRWADLQGEKTIAQRGPVSVTLSLDRTVEAVRLERAWCVSASPENIETAVLQTARLAYANYVAPVFVPGEHEELASEFEQARRDLMSILAKGSR